MLSQIPEYMINSDGALKEWVHGDLLDRYNHRHLSHLYPVWPGLEISPDRMPAMFNAAVVAAQKRGRGNSSAHGLMHMALVGTRLKDPDLVHGNLAFLMSNRYVNRSLVTNHNPGRIYNVDASTSLPGVVLEALVYSRPGVIGLLPAWSEKIPIGSVSNVLCRTAASVDNLAWNLENDSISATITSKKDQAVEIQLPRKVAAFQAQGCKVMSRSDESALIGLRAGKTAKLSIQFE
jgi:hypothetical protein